MEKQIKEHQYQLEKAQIHYVQAYDIVLFK